MLHVFWAPNDQHHVTWTGLSAGPFRLERAEALAGPWTTLYQGSATQHLSTPPEGPSVYQNWYYRLYDVASTMYGPATVRVSPDRTSRYVIWHADRQVRRMGIESYLVTERQQGDPCPDCWDDMTERRTKGTCSTCDSSGKVGGWPAPIPLWISYGIEEPQPVPIGETKAVELLQVEAWTSSFPLIKTGDYIVRPLDRRVYDVLRWQPTRKSAFLLRQTLVLRLVERASVVQELSSLVLYDPAALQGQSSPGQQTGFFVPAVNQVIQERMDTLLDGGVIE